jgi:hypothetical protein
MRGVTPPHKWGKAPRSAEPRAFLLRRYRRVQGLGGLSIGGLLADRLDEPQLGRWRITDPDRAASRLIS